MVNILGTLWKRHITISMEMIDKQTDKNTTSIKYKTDLYEFFKDKQIGNTLEIGAYRGYTTAVLSSFSKEVWAIELNPSIATDAKINAPKANIHWLVGDAYNSMTYESCPDVFDLVVVDCIHEYQFVTQDINRAMSFLDVDKGMYLVFDDYSHPALPGVRRAIDNAIASGMKFETYIGESAGFTYGRNNTTLIGPEGIILSYGI